MFWQDMLIIRIKKQKTDPLDKRKSHHFMLIEGFFCFKIYAVKAKINILFLEKIFSNNLLTERIIYYIMVIHFENNTIYCVFEIA